MAIFTIDPEEAIFPILKTGAELGKTGEAVLVDREQPPGSYNVVFDAGPLPSGVYHCVLRTPTGYYFRSMQLLR